MMRVLWISNLVFPTMASELGMREPVGGGWLLGLANAISKSGYVRLHVCAVSRETEGYREAAIDGITHHVIPYSGNTAKIAESIINLLSSVQFDIIHIFGSEDKISYAAVCASKEMGLLDRTVLHIQGLVSVCARHYSMGVPAFWRSFRMPRDWLMNTSITHQQKDFKKRGESEVEAIRMLHHLSGRTDWDRACAYQINPTAKYHFCNEVLRSSFYQHRWTLDKCERHSIFVSQGNYPIKRLHFMLEALPLILKHYPDTRLYVGGEDPTAQNSTLKAKLKRTSFGQYLLHLIKKHDLSKHVVFTGVLNEQQMCDRFLKSHVFVSPSIIENSPNSLGEAMLLGMPCVASSVGGVSNMLKDKEEGYLFQADAPYMLADFICRIFKDDSEAQRFGEAAYAHASVTHAPQRNLEQLLRIYQEVHAR